jgi:hypothetical protein
MRVKVGHRGYDNGSMLLIATPEAVEYIRAHGGALFIWAVTMAYGYDSVFALEASTESPGAGRTFRRIRSQGVDLLLDTGGRELPDELHVQMRGRRRRRIRAYWNGNSFAR